MDIHSLPSEKFKPTIKILTVYAVLVVTYVKVYHAVLKSIGYVSCTTLKVAPFFNQRSPLHAAASKGHDYTAECLLKRGADINIKDKDGVSMTILLNYGR